MAKQNRALVVLTLLCLKCVLCVRGDGANEDDQPEGRYALIGAGVGLILAIMFIAVKVCMIKRHMLDNSSLIDDSVRGQSLRSQSTRLHRRDAAELPDQP